MGKELAMAEVLKVPLEREKEDEYELSLELSIGGNYVKRLERKTREENDSRSDISENGYGFVDLQRKKEIQALRRQEARMKREEKLKKSRGLRLVEDIRVLEAQKLQARVLDRENREKDGILEDSLRRKEKNGTNEVFQDLNISLFTENKTDCLFPKVQYVQTQTRNGLGYSSVVEEEKYEKNEENVIGSTACWNGNGNSSMECQSSPAASDYQSTSRKGGSSSDTGSHSSSMPVHQNPHPSRSDKIEHQEVNKSSSHNEPKHYTKMVLLPTRQLHSTKVIPTRKAEAEPRPNQTNNICSKVTSYVANKVPKPPNHNNGGASIQHMPRVSTTGNGPNGKTITGFLCKYTNKEVSIICSCHGSSFSPMQFVEHAGGVDILHPLRHITMVLPSLER